MQKFAYFSGNCKNEVLKRTRGTNLKKSDPILEHYS